MHGFIRCCEHALWGSGFLSLPHRTGGCQGFWLGLGEGLEGLRAWVSNMGKAPVIDGWGRPARRHHAFSCLLMHLSQVWQEGSWLCPQTHSCSNRCRGRAPSSPRVSASVVPTARFRQKGCFNVVSVLVLLLHLKFLTFLFVPPAGRPLPTIVAMKKCKAAPLHWVITRPFCTVSLSQF